MDTASAPSRSIRSIAAWTIRSRVSLTGSAAWSAISGPPPRTVLVQVTLLPAALLAFHTNARFTGGRLVHTYRTEESPRSPQESASDLLGAGVRAQPLDEILNGCDVEVGGDSGQWSGGSCS